MEGVTDKKTGKTEDGGGWRRVMRRHRRRGGRTVRVRRKGGRRLQAGNVDGAAAAMEKSQVTVTAPIRRVASTPGEGWLQRGDRAGPDSGRSGAQRRGGVVGGRSRDPAESMRGAVMPAAMVVAAALQGGEGLP